MTPNVITNLTIKERGLMHLPSKIKVANILDFLSGKAIGH